jgi:hypothetical protein
MARHYWTHFPLRIQPVFTRKNLPARLYPVCSSPWRSNPDDARESIANLMRLAGNSGKDTATQKAVFRYFFDLCSHYFHDPNSPFVNEELFIPALKAFLESSLPDDEIKYSLHFSWNLP